MTSYTQAAERLGTRQGRKLENNTYLQRRDADTIVVLLHSTDIVTFHADGRVVLNTGGWKTVTTKDRMNKFSPVRIWSDRGTWYAGPWRENWQEQKAAAVPYVGDTLTINADGTIQGAHKLARASDKETKLRKAVAKFAKDYMAALRAGKVPAPGAGDCFYCGMHVVEGKDTGKALGEATHDHSHLLSHIKERYYVPSLVMNALKANGIEPDKLAGSAYLWPLADVWQPQENGNARVPADSHLWQGIGKMLRRYMLKQLGMAA